MKKLCTSILFLLLLFSCIHLLSPVLRPTGIDRAKNQIRSFHFMEENTIDVIAYGSSHCWNGFNSVEFQKNYGVTCYNYGCSWQQLNTTWLFFQDSLTTQSPKVVFMETYLFADRKHDQEIDGEIYYTREIPWSEHKKTYLRQCFGPIQHNWGRYLSYFVPFILNHSNWESINADSFVENCDSTDFKAFLGFNYNESETGYPVNISYKKNNEQVLPDASIEIIDEIVRVCREKNIELVFFTAPFEAEYEYGTFWENYAEKNGCYYVNFFERMEDAGIDMNSDFGDPNHLDASGATKVALYLGQFLIENDIMPEATPSK